MKWVSVIKAISIRLSCSKKSSSSLWGFNPFEFHRRIVRECCVGGIMAV